MRRSILVTSCWTQPDEMVEPLEPMIAAQFISQRRACQHAGDAYGLVDAR